MSIRCSKCKTNMKKVSNVNKMFLGKYVISDTTLYNCGKCGEEYIDAKEYERIRKKIEDIESKSKIPAVQQVLAKIKLFIL